MTPARLKSGDGAAPSVVLASRNAGKAREFSRLFGDVFDVVPVPPAIELPEETGETFEANARLKAETVFAALDGEMAVLADDSGLEVETLGGRPGIHSARFAGESAGDEENVARLLEELGHCDERKARFVCALCLVMPEPGCVETGRPEMVEVEGEARGVITRAPRGLDGFGYDPVFIPEGWEVTLAEAAPGDKDGISHRGAAARALLERLRAERVI